MSVGTIRVEEKPKEKAEIPENARALIRWYEGTRERRELVEGLKTKREITRDVEDVLCGRVFEVIALHYCAQLFDGKNGEGYFFG